MIDALFGSKTRIKLLHLFLNNPGKAFYVREITRLVDEQINSVRRELANLLEVGVITSASSDNKLYYEMNQLYEYYLPFRTIFGDPKAAKTPATSIASKDDEEVEWQSIVRKLSGLRVAIAAGVLVKNSASPIDLMLVGDLSPKRVGEAVKEAEKLAGKEVRFTTIRYDEFYYRLSVHDRFIQSILTNKHVVLLDTDNILKEQ
jgi:hypothetical protein